MKLGTTYHTLYYLEQFLWSENQELIAKQGFKFIDQPKQI